MNSAATISVCGRYRYTLERQFLDTGPILCWLMLSPGTADATKDDPTIRKVVGFSRRNGFGAAIIVNLFAWRATDPKDVVRNLSDAEGADNCAAIMEASTLADVVVCAWGIEKGRPWVSEQADRVLDWLDEHPVSPPRLVCLGTNGDGSPRHPLMVPYAQKLEPFRWAKKAGRK